MNVLLGGLVTLAVTAVVQIFIIPWVQLRNRRRERWEKDVSELETLLRRDLVRELAKISLLLERRLAVWPASNNEAEARESNVVGTGEWPDREKFPESQDIRYVSAALGAASVALYAITTQLWYLMDRVRLLNRHASGWAPIIEATEILIDSLESFASLPHDMDLVDDLEGVDRNRVRLIKALDYVADTMRPPPRHGLGCLRKKHSPVVIRHRLSADIKWGDPPR